MRNIGIAIIFSLSLFAATAASSPPRPSVTVNEIRLNFPESATFQATITGETEITSVVLEYGNQQQTCGEVIAKAFPRVTPGKTVNAEWTWEMRQSGSLPPGAQLWWRWRITDANGEETLTETETATWLDNTHAWQSMNNGEFLRLHWYEGDQTFATDLAKAAYNGLQFNETNSGLKADAPIDIYIYANTEDLQEATLYEPAWTGGQAFPDQNIVILGVSPSDLEWGRDTIVHELTHVLVGHLTFSCLGDVPTWLNEGLAVSSEGELDGGSQRQFEQAVREDTLLSIRSLSSGFSEVPDKAYLSYSESYSVTRFLIETYGQDKMTSLLVALKGGMTIDEALQQTYGFNVEGLEDAWRGAIDAQPRAAAAQPTTQSTPTFVPTIVPVSGIALPLQATPSAIPTSSFATEPPGTVVRRGPPLSLTLMLLGLCCAMSLVIGVFVIGILARNQSARGGKNE